MQGTVNPSSYDFVGSSPTAPILVSEADSWPLRGSPPRSIFRNFSVTRQQKFPFLWVSDSGILFSSHSLSVHRLLFTAMLQHRPQVSASCGARWRRTPASSIAISFEPKTGIAALFSPKFPIGYGKITENGDFAFHKSLNANGMSFYVMGLYIPCFTFFSSSPSFSTLFLNDSRRHRGSHC